MIRTLVMVAAIVATGMQTASAEGPRARILTFDQLDGWASDDHSAALKVFLTTCSSLDGPDWAAVCRLGADVPDAKAFFELFFRPVLVEDGTPGLFTGYFEPELDGATRPDARHRYPVYRKPPELKNGTLWFTRREIEEQGLLEGRGLEIAWVDDPVELFFMQVQGSGRIRLEDGSVIRVGYAGANGHPYRSIGKELVRRGVYNEHQVSAQVIRAWVRRNAEAGRELLLSNPSYVFFRVLKDLGPDSGPLGAMNRPLTPLRSIAVDPAFVPLGAPVWLEKGGPGQMRRLMVAQDTGSAIKGAQRADIYFGTGEEAGRAAGMVNDPGRIIQLLPIDIAYARLENPAR